MGRPFVGKAKIFQGLLRSDALSLLFFIWITPWRVEKDASYAQKELRSSSCSFWQGKATWLAGAERLCWLTVATSKQACAGTAFFQLNAIQCLERSSPNARCSRSRRLQCLDQTKKSKRHFMPSPANLLHDRSSCLTKQGSGSLLRSHSTMESTRVRCAVLDQAWLLLVASWHSKQKHPRNLVPMPSVSPPCSSPSQALRINDDMLCLGRQHVSRGWSCTVLCPLAALAVGLRVLWISACWPFGQSPVP